MIRLLTQLRVNNQWLMSKLWTTQMRAMTKELVLHTWDLCQLQEGEIRTFYSSSSSFKLSLTHCADLLSTVKSLRSHQLRVHLAHIGHPIVGDTLYAPPNVILMSPRLCLHAQHLKFKHPATKEVTVISSKKCDFFPPDFATVSFI